MYKDYDGSVLDAARDVLKHTVGAAYVPMKGLRPLTDSELGRIARLMIPELANEVVRLSEEELDRKRDR